MTTTTKRPEGTAGAVVLVAKVPRSGSSKTRLAPWLTPDGAVGPVACSSRGGGSSVCRAYL